MISGVPSLSASLTGSGHSRSLSCKHRIVTEGGGFMSHRSYEIGRSILVVDDDQDTCQMMGVLLSECSVTSAETVAQALYLATKTAFDLYILDNWILDQSGIELCRKIRALDANAPIIFCSAAAYEEDRREAMEAGANAYFVKPMDVFNLQDSVRYWLTQAW